jgi:hypothetical protein
MKFAIKCRYYHRDEGSEAGREDRDDAEVQGAEAARGAGNMQYIAPTQVPLSATASNPCTNNTHIYYF